MMLTQPQAEPYVGRSERTFTTWVAEGLPYTKQPGCRHRLFDTHDLDVFRERMAERYRTGCGRPRKATK